MTVDELSQRRFELLTQKLERLLDAHKTVVYDSEQIEDIEEWRKAARAAGRRLGIKMSTGVARDGSKVWATEES